MDLFHYTIDIVHESLTHYPRFLELIGIPFLSRTVIRTPILVDQPSVDAHHTNIYRVSLLWILNMSKKTLTDEEVLETERIMTNLAV